MIRVCLETPIDLKLIEKADGSVDVEGFGAEQGRPTLDFNRQEHRPLNVSFYATMDANECLDRLKQNLSDITNVFVPIFTESPDYQSSEIGLVDKVQFLTGYTILEGEIREKETATVFTNADLLDLDVYLWCGSLIFSLYCSIMLRVVLRRHHQGTWQCSRISLWQLAARNLGKMRFSSQGRYRWIQFLYALVAFYMVTSFLCLYKTSQVIVDTPFYPKTYQESLDHNSSLSYFYDKFTVVSKSFERAPADTLRGKLWKKLKNSGRREFLLMMDDAADRTQGLRKLSELMKEVSKDKSIVIAASTMIKIVKATLRGLSPESELWVLKIFSDPSEAEIIYGSAMQKESPLAKHISRRYRLMHESFVGVRHFEESSEAITQLLGTMMGTSRRHQVRQMIILDDEYAFDVEHDVEAIPLSYFREFFMDCFVIWLIALIIKLNSL